MKVKFLFFNLCEFNSHSVIAMIVIGFLTCSCGVSKKHQTKERSKTDSTGSFYRKAVTDQAYDSLSKKVNERMAIVDSANDISRALKIEFYQPADRSIADTGVLRIYYDSVGLFIHAGGRSLKSIEGAIATKSRKTVSEKQLAIDSSGVKKADRNTSQSGQNSHLKKQEEKKQSDSFSWALPFYAYILIPTVVIVAIILIWRYRLYKQKK